MQGCSGRAAVLQDGNLPAAAARLPLPPHLLVLLCRGVHKVWVWQGQHSDSVAAAEVQPLWQQRV